MRKLLERRVPQLVGLYLVGSWGFVQFVDWAQQEYALSPELTNFVVALLLLLLPSVLILAWRHGMPGPNQWNRVDAAALVANVLGAAIVLAAVFGGRSLGATTTTVTVEDPEGREVERVVARDAFRSKVFLPYLDNATGDSTLDWLTLGVPAALDLDLVQDLFVQGDAPVGTRARAIHVELQRAGVADGANVPLALQLKLAGERHMDHLLTGRLVPSDSGLAVDVELYDVLHGHRVARRTVVAPGVFALVDSLTDGLKRDLGVPTVQVETSRDLPVAELLTSSTDAYRDFVLSERAAARGDAGGQLELLRAAIAKDSTFALACLSLAMAAADAGEAEAQAAMREAMAHLYRLPESAQLAARTIDEFLFQKDSDRAIATARYWAGLYPDDVRAHLFLSELYSTRGDWKASAAELETILSIDPTEYGTLQELGRLYLSRGDFARALSYQERYIELFPDDAGAFEALGNLHLWKGEQAEARDAFEQAALIDPGNPSYRVDLALVDVHTGDFAAARGILREALAASRAGADSARAWKVDEFMDYRSGQWAPMQRAARSLASALRSSHTPSEVAMQLLQANSLRWAGEWGRAAPVLRTVDSLDASLQPPMDELAATYVASFRAELGDTAGARQAAAVAEKALTAYGVSSERDELEIARGLLAERSGDYAAAAGYYRAATEVRPIYETPRLYLGRALREAGRSREAGALLEEVIHVSPGFAKARLELARTWLALGRKDEAKAQLDTALAIWKDADPDYAPAQEARALRDSVQQP